MQSFVFIIFTHLYIYIILTLYTCKAYYFRESVLKNMIGLSCLYVLVVLSAVQGVTLAMRKVSIIHLWSSY